MTDDEATAVAAALAAKDARIAWLEATIATQARIIGRYQETVSRLLDDHERRLRQVEVKALQVTFSDN
ncbi:MAG: hypothetical protein PHR35_21915 [Kiritimatiellae bacterium]|jgi:uncharacterized coiled-coil protein SlyX|nr:hypothetical protein [Kiritimatiellia bacterium]